MRALIVDDNPADRMLVRRELERRFPGAEVVDVGAASQFQAALAQETFDLVVTDYQLRWGDGIDILTRVKARTPDCVVIMFTSTGTQEIAVMAMKAGLDDYVIKAQAHYVRLPVAIEAALERAATRRRARALEARLGRLLDRLEVGIFRFDGNGRLVEGNPAFLRLIAAKTLEDAQTIDLTPLLAVVRAAGSGASPRRVTLRGVNDRVISLAVTTEGVEDDSGMWFEGTARPIQ